jgi:very-short-patch-repair endonuclease/membrane-bound inhibitor of C-type lysozyme
VLRVSKTAKGTETIQVHAAAHSTTPESLWLISQGLSQIPLCACGCGKPLLWQGWHVGYASFLQGHNANTETPEARLTRLNALRQSYASGKSHGWSKGLTKENDDRIKLRAEQTSKGRKAALAAGTIQIWSKGKTKEEDQRLLAYSIKAKNSFATGERVAWHSGKNANSDDRIRQKNERLKARYANGELTPWSKGLTAAVDERLEQWAERRREKCASLGFEYPTRLTLEQVKERLTSLKQIKPVDTTFSSYRNWQLRNLLFYCVECGTTSMESLQTAMTDRCVRCNPFSSLAQRQIYTYIRDTLGFNDAILNDRVLIKPYELDVVVPSNKFAIEYNGLYHHNARYRATDYHDKKSNLVKAHGFKLLHVFEDEWENKSNIVKSMIRHRLGINPSLKGGARACRLVELSAIDRKNFFSINHLDGDVSAFKTAGLIDENDRLVAAASVRFPMHRNKYNNHIELARFATINNLCVPGALSRLTKWVKSIAKELQRGKLLTYADERVGTGTAYTVSGWKFLKMTDVRFWWTDNHVRYNRFKVRASADESERVKAERLGLHKIYGCRNAVYEIVL